MHLPLDTTTTTSTITTTTTTTTTNTVYNLILFCAIQISQQYLLLIPIYMVFPYKHVSK